MKKRIPLLCFMLFVLQAGFAQGKWELKKNENGIQVFTRKAVIGNVKELRVVCELDVTEAQFISTILDIGNYNSWIYANKKSAILKTEAPGKIIYYTQSHLPWPIKDRDLVVELNLNQTPENLNIQVKSIPDFMPKNPDFIRVPYSLATWNVTQATNNKLKVDYTFSIDPGGSIPSWIVNATLTIGPYNSFLKLKELLKAKYGK